VLVHAIFFLPGCPMAGGSLVTLVRSSEREGDFAMKYMMFVCTDTEPETDLSQVPDIEEWVADVQRSGARVTGERLAPESTATTVRVRGGELLITDGPFAETKEVIAGFDILECADLDEAIEIARKHPMAYHGRLELRAFDPLSLDAEH
jgi:hypothetical protein